MQRKIRCMKTLFRHLLPPSCFLCLASCKQTICDGCQSDLPINRNACYRCASTLSGSDINLCGQCITHPPAFDKTIAAYKYEQPIQYMVMQFKFQRQLRYATVLAALLAKKIKQSYGNNELPSAIVPMPLHIKRQRQRGFNQSLEIAKILAKELHLNTYSQNCIRTINTPPQTELSGKQRRQNVKNAFAVKKEIPDKHVAIIDDVITTGSTANELAAQLKRSGIKRVDIWCCCKTQSAID